MSSRSIALALSSTMAMRRSLGLGDLLGVGQPSSSRSRTRYLAKVRGASGAPRRFVAFDFAPDHGGHPRRRRCAHHRAQPNGGGTRREGGAGTLAVQTSVDASVDPTKQRISRESDILGSPLPSQEQVKCHISQMGSPTPQLDTGLNRSHPLHRPRLRATLTHQEHWSTRFIEQRPRRLSS